MDAKSTENIELFSIERLKTKTKLNTLTNHKVHRQCGQSIKTRSKYVHVAYAKQRNTYACTRDMIGFDLLLIGRKRARVFKANRVSQ